MIKYIKILLITGFLVIGVINAEEWEVITEMPIPVKGAQAITHNSLIYVIGGWSDSTFSPINKIQIFNPKDTSWVVIEDTLAIGRYGHVVLSDSNRALIFGGGATEDSLDRILESWDFITSPTTITFDPVFNRQFATAQIYNDMIYVFGGYSTEFVDDTSGMVIYNLSSDLVEHRSTEGFAAENVPIHLMSSIIDENIYIFGGADYGISRDIHVYNTISQSMTHLEYALLDERAGGGALVINEFQIALIGGYNEANQPMSSVEVLAISGNSIDYQANAEPLNYARSEPAVVFYDSFTYVFGGRDSFDNCIPYVERAIIESSATTLLESDQANRSIGYELFQNYPNPFNPSTTIQFNNSHSMPVNLDVYSVNGVHIKSLVNKHLEPGQYQFIWEGRDKNNRPVSSGIYFYKFENGFASETKRMILLR